MKLYLCGLKINGCKNLNQTIDLQFCNTTIKSIVDFKNTNIKAIYGPNGAGKSAIMTAMSIYEQLISNLDNLDNKYFASFIKEVINKDTNKLEIEVTFLIYREKDHKYLKTFRHYISFVNNNGNVLIEKECFMGLNGNSIKDDKFKELLCLNNGKIVKLEDKKNKLLNKLFISELNVFEKKSIVSLSEDLMDEEYSHCALSVIASNLFALNLFVYLEKEDLHEDYLHNKIYLERALDSSINEKNKELKDDNQKNKKLLFNLSVQGYDVINIKSLKDYENNVKKLEMFLKIFKPNLKKIYVEKKVNENKYFCNKILCYDNEIDIEFESTGIKKLVRIFNSLLMCSNGRIVFIDEFDANLHDVYFCKLVEFMKVYAKGQLCFTTHNLEPIEILKDNSYSLDFLSNDSRIFGWIKNGNQSPLKRYINGLIDYSPFNVSVFDFIPSLLNEDN